jgi:hypothetical protein
MTLPGSSAKLTLRSTGLSWPASCSETFSTDSLPAGAGSAVGSLVMGTDLSSAVMRPWASRALVKPRHAPMPCSTGASARPRMIEAAIMPPAVSWPSVTR